MTILRALNSLDHPIGNLFWHFSLWHLDLGKILRGELAAVDRSIEIIRGAEAGRVLELDLLKRLRLLSLVIVGDGN